MLPCPIDGSYPFRAIHSYQVASQSPSEPNSVCHETPVSRGRRSDQL